jgi:hypothetical protein
MRGFFGPGPIFRFAPGVSLQYQYQRLPPFAGAPLSSTDNTTLQTNLNAMSGAPVVRISGGTLPASGIVVSCQGCLTGKVSLQLQAMNSKL